MSYIYPDKMTKSKTVSKTEHRIAGTGDIIADEGDLQTVIVVSGKGRLPAHHIDGRPRAE